MVFEFNIEEEVVDSFFWTDFFYNDYVVEIFGGLLLSAMGLFLIWFLRPKVKISPIIGLETNSKGEKEFVLKVINRSYLFQLVDVHFELSRLKPMSTPKGMNLAIKKIPLKSEHIWFLSRRKFFSKQDSFATYAIVLTIEDYDLINEWKKHDGMFLDFKVIAKNNFSGITGIYHEKYNHFSCVKEGSFCHGNSMAIENGG